MYLMPITVVLSYFVVLYLIPNFLLKKKYRLFLLYSVYTIVISFAGIVLSIFYGLVFSSYLKDLNTAVLTKSVPLIILGVYFITVVATAIGLFVYSYYSGVKNEDLKNKFLQTQLQLKEQELKFLKMQLHPHFLFNSLNTIYGIALKKGDEAPEMILRLSNLLDYILYQVDKKSVLLIDEVNHLEDYLALEKMRFHDTLKVNFKKNIAEQDLQIAPMLLIPFVENSFKHGGIVNGFLSIDIDVKTTKNQLLFCVSNTVQDDIKSSGGIGLKNIEKRLNMLYPNKHELEIKQDNTTFSVALKIEFDV